MADGPIWDAKLIATGAFYALCAQKSIDATINYFDVHYGTLFPDVIVINDDTISASIVLIAFLIWLAMHFYFNIIRYFPDVQGGRLSLNRYASADRVVVYIYRAIPRLRSKIKQITRSTYDPENHLLVWSAESHIADPSGTHLQRILSYSHLAVSLGLFYLLAANIAPPNNSQLIIVIGLVFSEMILAFGEVNIGSREQFFMPYVAVPFSHCLGWVIVTSIEFLFCLFVFALWRTFPSLEKYSVFWSSLALGAVFVTLQWKQKEPGL